MHAERLAQPPVRRIRELWLNIGIDNAGPADDAPFFARKPILLRQTRGRSLPPLV